jgi:hypothetical protein
MPSIYIGKCGAADAASNAEWALSEIRLGVIYVKFACGPRPPDSELGVMWMEGPSGRYPAVGLQYEDEVGPVPRDYLARATRALRRFNAAVAWKNLGIEQGGPSLTPEEELACLLRDVPPKNLADQLAGIFCEVHETNHMWLAGEASLYGLHEYGELLDFSVRLWRLDPVAFVTRFHQVSKIDLRELEDADPLMVARGVLHAVRGDC